MASNPDISYSAARNFGEFTGEFFHKFSVVLGKLEGRLVQKAESVKQPVFKAAYEKLKVYQETIANAILWIGILNKFYYSALLIPVGVVSGAAASTQSFLVEFETLSDRKLFGDTAQEGYAIQKVMGFLAGTNWYLGDTLFDNMFFGIFSGLIVGNTLYHNASNSRAGKFVKSSGDTLSKVVSTLVNPFFSSAA